MATFELQHKKNLPWVKVKILADIQYLIREVILELLAKAYKLSHLGLSYLVRRSTFSQANQRRSSQVFGDIYMDVYCNHVSVLLDSRLSDADLRRLYIMDSTTISLFKEWGATPKKAGRKEG